MKFIVVCECQQTLEFEAEPVYGRKPPSMSCPTCNADCTNAAYKVIQDHLARQSLGSGPEIPLQRDDPGMEESAPPTTDGTCARHAGQVVISLCRVCRKPTCAKCMEETGFVCSAYCRHQAHEQGIEIPAYERQFSVVRQQKRSQFQSIVNSRILATGVIVLGVIALWCWQNLYAGKPHVISSQKISSPEYGSFSRFISADELLMIDDTAMTLVNVSNSKPVWTTDLKPYARVAFPIRPKKTAPAKKSTTPSPPNPDAEDEGDGKEAMPAEDGESPDPVEKKLVVPSDETAGEAKEEMADTEATNDTDGEPDTAPKQPPLSAEEPKEEVYDFGWTNLEPVIVMPQIIWATFPQRIVGFDRRTGKEIKQIPVDGRLLGSDPDSTAYWMMKRIEGKRNQSLITRIDLSTGAMQTAEFDIPRPKIPTRKELGLPERRRFGDFTERSYTDSVDEFQRSFHPSGASLAQVDVVLRRVNFVTVDTLKPRTRQDEERIPSVGNQLEMIPEIVGDIKRALGGGSRQEDQSAYEVTLRRIGAPAPAWQGEVTGETQYFALRSLDLLVAGKTLYAFGKDNQKLWESPLAFPVSSGPSLFSFAEGGGRDTPYLETDDTLYFADTGMLAALDLRTGKARWRLPTVGVSRIERDQSGYLYVTTSQKSHSSIQYSEEINLMERHRPVLLKIHPKKGKIIWQKEFFGERCILGGRYLYSIGSGMSIFDMAEGVGSVWRKRPNEEEAVGRVRLHCISARNGEELWDESFRGSLLTTQFKGNRAILLFRDRIDQIRFSRMF